MNKKTILITGASGGIGGAVAWKFLRKGWNVIALVRDLKKNETQELMKHPGATVVKCDLESYESIDMHIGMLVRDGVTFDRVFLGAGTFLWDDGFPGGEKTREEVAVLLYLANVMTKLTVLAALRTHCDTSKIDIHIVSSHAARFDKDHAFRNGKYKEEEYVEKMLAVSTLAESLQAERVFASVTLLEPGLINTDMAKNAFTPDRVGPIDWSTVDTPEVYIEKVFTNVVL